MNEMWYRSISVCIEKTGFVFLFFKISFCTSVLFARMYMGTCVS